MALYKGWRLDTSLALSQISPISCLKQPVDWAKMRECHYIQTELNTFKGHQTHQSQNELLVLVKLKNY